MKGIGSLIVRWQPWTAAGILSHIWQSSIVGLAILAVMFAARRSSARTRWMIGWIGLLKFIFPVIWFSAIAVRLDPSAASAWSDIFAAPAVLKGSTIAEGAPKTPSPLVPSASASSRDVSWAEVGAGVWAAGSVFLLLRWGLRGSRFRRQILVQAELVSARLQRKIEQAGAKAGLTSIPRCVAIHGSASPGILGVLFPVIVLPREMESFLSDAEIEAVLIHELIHFRRRDTLLLWLQAAVVGLFWFDPVVWLLNRQLCVEIEKSCDEAVLEITADGRIYAGSILKMVGQSLGPRETGFAGATSVPIAARLKNILAYPASPHRGWPKFIAIGAAIALAIISGFAESGRADEATSASWGKVLIFRNIPSWNRIPDFEMVLRNLGVAFTGKKSSEIAETDFSPYRLIIIPGAQQGTGFYVDYARASAKFDDFVRNGGTLLLELNGAETEGITLPGGATMVREAGFINVVTQPRHPAVAQFSTKPLIFANLASSGYLKGAPADAVVLAVEEDLGHPEGNFAKPTYLEYGYGHGHVIGACQCFHDQDRSHRGPLMPAVLKYAMARNWFLPDPNAKQEVGAMLSAVRAEEGTKFTALLTIVSGRQSRLGAGDAASRATLAPGMKAVGSFTEAGDLSPSATVETMEWSMHHGATAELAKLIEFNPAGRDAAELFYESLPENIRSEAQSPERMLAAMIAYGYPTGVGFQTTEDSQIGRSPNDWAIRGRIQKSDGQIQNVNFGLRKIDGAWKTMVGPPNICNLESLLTEEGPLPPPAED